MPRLAAGGRVALSTLAAGLALAGSALPARADRPYPPGVGWPLPARGPAPVTSAHPQASVPSAESTACSATAWDRIILGTLEKSAAPIWSLSVDLPRGQVFVGTPAQEADGATLFKGDTGALSYGVVGDLRGIPVAALAMGAGTGADVWAGGTGEYGKTYRSVNAGQTFTGADSPAELSQARSLAMASGPDGTVTGATRFNDYPIAMVWSNGWQVFGDMSDINRAANGQGRALWDIAQAPDGRGWLAPDNSGLWRLAAPNDRWVQVGDASLHNSTVMAVSIDPKNAQRVFVGLGPPLISDDNTVYQRGLRFSTDGGDSWSTVRLPFATAVMGFAFGHEPSGSGPEPLYAATWGDGLWKSLDYGDTWQRIVGPPDGFVRRVALVVPSGATANTCELILAGTNSGLYVRNLARAKDYSVYVPLLWKDWSREEIFKPVPAAGPTVEYR